MKNPKQSFTKHFMLVCMMILAGFASAQAQITYTWTVNTTADLADADDSDGICATVEQTCSLRAALYNAGRSNSHDIINFSEDFQAPNPPKTIVLTLGSLSRSTFNWASANTTINGPGARQLIIDGNNQDRVFSANSHSFGNIDSGALTITDLTIQNGRASGYGGGGIANTGVLFLKRVVIRNNQNTYTGEYLGGGGGIANSGNLTIEDSTISGNHSDKDGGGIYSTRRIAMKNSTISNNTADQRGGGIYTIGSPYTFDGNVTNATITNNFAGQAGGGIFVALGNSAPLEFFVGNSIVANNQALFNKDVAGLIVSLGGNLVKDRGTSNGYVATDLPNGTDPHLGSLQNNGGPTDTRAILFPSAAIDGGKDCPTFDGCIGVTDFDQRGAGFPRKVGSAVDIGAFEYQLQRQSSNVTGTVLRPNNRGLNRALVTMTSLDGTVQTTYTDKDGMFRFTGEEGEQYIVSVESRQYKYDSQRLTLTENSPSLVFTPVETPRQ